MAPEANLKDKPHAVIPAREGTPTGLVEAGMDRAPKALEIMRRGNDSSAPPFTLEDRSAAGTGRTERSQPGKTDQTTPQRETEAQPKTKAFGKAPTFPNSRKYAVAYGNNSPLEIEQRWQNNTIANQTTLDGTISGSTRYVVDNKAVHLYWRQEQNGQLKPDYAVESSRNAAGDLVHNYFDYSIDAQGHTTIDHDKDRGQIIVRNDEKGDVRGGFVRAPKSKDGSYELTVFDKNTEVISKQPITETVAHDETALAALEEKAAQSSTQPVARIATNGPTKPAEKPDSDTTTKPKTSDSASQPRTKALEADSGAKPKSVERLADGSTRETIENGDGTLTQRHLLGSSTVVTEFDKSKQLRETTTLDRDGRAVSKVTYDTSKKDEITVTFAHQDSNDAHKMLSKSWNSKGLDPKGNRIWTEMPPDGTSPSNAQRTCYNLNFDMNEGSYTFNDAAGDRYIGTCNSNDVVQDKSAEALDAKERIKLGDTAYEKERSDLQKKLEAKGISFSDKSGVRMGDRLIPTDVPTLQQLKAVEKAMEKFLPSDESELKHKVKFTFLQEDMNEINGRYTDNGNIYIYPQASRIQSCFQEDTGVGHRAQRGQNGESLVATIVHEWTHYNEEGILADKATRQAYVNSYGVDVFADPTKNNKETWAVQGNHEYTVDGKTQYSLYTAVEGGNGTNSYQCSVNIGSDGKPSLAIKSAGESGYLYYERRNPDGSLYIGPGKTIDDLGSPERISGWDLKKVARLTPSSHYLTGWHAATEARTQFELGGLSRTHLFENSDHYEKAKKDDQALIGPNHIRLWDGKIVPSTPELVKQIEAEEAKLKRYVHPS